MADINEVERALNAVGSCRSTQVFFDRYVSVNPQGACIMDVRLSADSPEWGAIKAILQAKLSRELEVVERAFQQACSGVPIDKEPPTSSL